eukprot:c31057_g1_i1 orf=89-271(+)
MQQLDQNPMLSTNYCIEMFPCTDVSAHSIIWTNLHPQRQAYGGIQQVFTNKSSQHNFMYV